MMEELHMGDHAALFYRSKADQLACALPYIAIGLKRNERCVYIAVDNPALEILRRLDELGVNTAAALQRGALRVVTKSETYMRHGVFEPEKMVDDFHRDVQQALQDGFAGLRASGEMSWALDLPSALFRVIEYEQELHARWPAHLSGLCQYDESRFPAQLIDEMTKMHRVIVRGGKIIRRSVQGDLVPV